jgi:hypothetical protein
MDREGFCQAGDLENLDDARLGGEQMQLSSGVVALFECANEHAECDGVEKSGVQQVDDDLGGAARYQLVQLFLQLRGHSKVDLS